MINVLIAIEQAVAVKLRDNFRLIDKDNPELGTVRNDLTPAQKKKLKMAYSGHHKKVTVAGTTYIIIDFYFPPITVGSTKDPVEDDPRLLWLERFKELLPGKEFVLGAWDRTGAQYGTKIIPPTYDENGDEVTGETIEGTPVYPIHARLLDVMPDDVTYDENGNETSRTAATAPKQVHKILGWKDRRW